MKKRTKKMAAGILIILFAVTWVSGCGQRRTDEEKDKVLSNNILITETGEVLEKPEEELEEESAKEPLDQKNGFLIENMNLPEDEVAPTPAVELDVPVQEQVITQEDQTEPGEDNDLQLVFLGDSIFDNNRDGTGIPYLTSEQCGADVFNLAIGGTSATIEVGEYTEFDRWTSTSLCGVVNALMNNISTSIFEGTRTKEILDNPRIDFSQTDYFIIEYGTNDFFRAVRQSDPDNIFNIYTYAGALRYAIVNLKELAPDATIILCSPCYAQFFHDGFMVGDGNITNSGNGTLFDYKGTCNAVANEMQTEFFNAYQDLGIDGLSADEYLEDGVHLTEAGRRLYADALAHRILKIEETKNN